MTQQNQEWQEQQMQARAEWLKNNLCDEDDVSSDKNGEYYVHTENDGATEKQYLPVELNLEIIKNFSHAPQN